VGNIADAGSRIVGNIDDAGSKHAGNSCAGSRTVDYKTLENSQPGQLAAFHSHRFQAGNHHHLPIHQFRDHPSLSPFTIHLAFFRTLGVRNIYYVTYKRIVLNYIIWMKIGVVRISEPPLTRNVSPDLSGDLKSRNIPLYLN